MTVKIQTKPEVSFEITLNGNEAKIFNAVHKTRPDLGYVLLTKGQLVATDGSILISLSVDYDGPDAYFNKPEIMPTKTGELCIRILTPEDVFPVRCEVEVKRTQSSSPVTLRDCHEPHPIGKFPDVKALYAGLKNRAVTEIGLNFKLLSKLIDVLGPNVRLEFNGDFGPVEVWPGKELRPRYPSLIMPMRLD